jgi:hypothetical protein
LNSYGHIGNIFIAKALDHFVKTIRPSAPFYFSYQLFWTALVNFFSSEHRGKWTFWERNLLTFESIFTLTEQNTFPVPLYFSYQLFWTAFVNFCFKGTLRKMHVLGKTNLLRFKSIFALTVQNTFPVQFYFSYQPFRTTFINFCFNWTLQKMNILGKTNLLKFESIFAFTEQNTFPF